MELLGKPNQKMEKSFDFFKTTKISTCSYIKKDGGDFKAIPYYTRPKQQFSELASKYGVDDGRIVEVLVYEEHNGRGVLAAQAPARGDEEEAAVRLQPERAEEQTASVGAPVPLRE